MPGQRASSWLAFCRVVGLHLWAPRKKQPGRKETPLVEFHRPRWGMGLGDLDGRVNAWAFASWWVSSSLHQGFELPTPVLQGQYPEQVSIPIEQETLRGQALGSIKLSFIPHWKFVCTKASFCWVMGRQRETVFALMVIFWQPTNRLQSPCWHRNLANSLSLSKPQFLHLQNEDNSFYP